MNVPLMPLFIWVPLSKLYFFSFHCFRYTEKIWLHHAYLFCQHWHNLSKLQLLCYTKYLTLFSLYKLILCFLIPNVFHGLFTLPLSHTSFRPFHSTKLNKKFLVWFFWKVIAVRQQDVAVQAIGRIGNVEERGSIKIWIFNSLKILPEVTNTDKTI